MDVAATINIYAAYIRSYTLSIVSADSYRQDLPIPG